MTIPILFPRLLAACFALSIAASIAAQSNNADGRLRYALSKIGEPKPIDNHGVTVPLVTIEERAPLMSVSESSLLGRFHTQLSAAIEARLGAHYHYGATGPNTFDCSGFVWSSFQAAGIKFERSSARSLWGRFTPPTNDERFRFGTLVFFSRLKHIGIVADEHGFYHSSRHHGVVYSPFNKYWLSRIDGFRRVALDSMQAPAANEKARVNRPAVNAQSIEGAGAP
jgi:cell wall-associated NlpC family hydrolase